MYAPSCKVNELESPLLFRCAQELGWDGWTEVLVRADRNGDSIRITRYSGCCFLCDDSSSALYSLLGYQVCDRCVDALLKLRAQQASPSVASGKTDSPSS